MFPGYSAHFEPSDLLRQDLFKVLSEQHQHHSPRSGQVLSCIPITMVPCECGQPFDDLTDWKAHSTATGNCCIYRCQKPNSAASSPGFAFETPTSSTIVTSRASAWKAPTASEGFLNEGYYYNLSDDAWKGLVTSNMDSCYPLLGAWNAPAVSTLHSPNSVQSHPQIILQKIAHRSIMPFPKSQYPLQGCRTSPTRLLTVKYGQPL